MKTQDKAGLWQKLFGATLAGCAHAFAGNIEYSVRDVADIAARMADVALDEYLKRDFTRPLFEQSHPPEQNAAKPADPGEMEAGE